MKIKIPEYIRQNMQYYKWENHFLCPACNMHDAKFVYLKFNGDKIFWLFNCTAGCGEDFKSEMSYKQLRELYFQYTYATDKTEVECYWLYEMFYMGIFYDTVFQHETEKEAFKLVVYRLNKDSDGWKNLWYRRLYADKKSRKRRKVKWQNEK